MELSLMPLGVRVSIMDLGIRRTLVLEPFWRRLGGGEKRAMGGAGRGGRGGLVGRLSSCPAGLPRGPGGAGQCALGGEGSHTPLCSACRPYSSVLTLN